MTTSKQTDPFSYLSQPIYNDIYRHLGCLICFEQPVPPDLHEKIEQNIPFPLKHDSIWSDSLFYAGTGNWLEADLRIAYNNNICERLREKDCATICNYLEDKSCPLEDFERINLIFSEFDLQPTDEEKAAFSSEFDSWLQELHQLTPISFVYTSDLMQLEKFNAWCQRSTQAVPQHIVPRLRALWGSHELRSQQIDPALPPIADKATQAIVNLFLQSQTSLEPNTKDALVDLIHTIIQTLEGYPNKSWSEGFLLDVLSLGGTPDPNAALKKRVIIA